MPAAEVARTDSALRTDAAWRSALAVIRASLAESGPSTPPASVHFHLTIYSTPAGAGHLVLAGPGTAVAAGPGSRRGPWLTFDISDGLVSGHVAALLQDRRGRLWFATQEQGVSSYDGSRLVTFSGADGLPDYAVRDILEDNAGNLWFATAAGVSRYDGIQWLSLTTDDGLLNNDVAAVVEDERGDLWFATAAGVSRYDEARYVLVVDDHATNRHILVEMLGSWRMQPTSVASGSEALDELRQAADSDQPYRLVLSDVMMPGMDGLELVEHMRADPALREVTVILLSSAGGADDASRLRELAISRSLIKPVKPSDLLDAITAAFATTAAARPFRPGSGIGNEAVDTDRQLHILLAEDGVINQRVAIGMLERRGHSVVLVDSGRKVLEKLAEEVFDVVLMDVQMPEMDGFEATEVIRRNEKTTGDLQPVVAMTAHAIAAWRPAWTARCQNR
jgi:CheY-like chemotaxis protein